MKRIIVPTDFSKTSWNAALHALEYANILNAEIVLINAFEEAHGGATAMLSIKEELRKDSNREVNIVLNELKNQQLAAGITIHALSMYGDLTNALHNYVSTNGDDLIVIGTEGRSGLGAKLFGSNTSKVVAKIDCPIIIIPPKYHFSLSKGIACAISEFKDINDSDVALLTEIVSNYYKPVLQLLHITTEEEAVEDDLILPFSEFDTLETEYIDLIGNNIPEMLENYSLKTELNCLVLLKKDRSFIEKLFHKSVSSEMINHAHIPLLVLRST